MPDEAKMFTTFLEKHRRAPFADKGEKPWTYCGWLLFYVQGWHADPTFPFPDRWGYLHAFLVSPYDPGPIPKVHFEAPSDEARKHLENCILEVESKHGSWSGFSLLVDWLLYGCGISKEPSTLEDSLQEKLYKTFNAGLLLQAPYDYFGAIISERKGSGKWNPTKFFPTPHPVCELMAQMSFHDMGEFASRFRMMNDCCMGTGRMQMHAGNYSLMLSGADIDPLVLKCAKLNGVFFVPWLVYPVEEPPFFISKKPAKRKVAFF